MMVNQKSEVRGHPGEMRSAVVNEFHRAGRSEVGGRKSEVRGPFPYAPCSMFTPWNPKAIPLGLHALRSSAKIGLFALLIALLFSGVAFGYTADGITFTYRKDITIYCSKVDSTLTNFPVLVKLTSSNIDFTHFLHETTDGHDIRFSDSVDVNGDADGNILDYERERFDKAGEKAEIWVEVQSVASDSNTTFHMFYGDETCVDGEAATGVWDTDFKMVQHLQETAGTHEDSTSTNNDSTAVSVTTQGSATGKIDGADEFDGVDDYVKAGVTSFSTTAGTYESWVNFDDWGSGNTETIFSAPSEMPNTDTDLVLHMRMNSDWVDKSYTTTGTASETIAAVNTKIAQKFTSGSGVTKIGSVDLYQTAGGNLVGDIGIYTDSGGNPNTLVTNAYCNDKTLNAGSVTHIPLHAISTISQETTYWIVFSMDSGSGTFQGGTTEPNDQCEYYDGSWHTSGNVENIYFKTYGQTDDVSGSGNNGKLIGASSTSSGRFGRAGSFDGSNDYINCGSGASLDLTTDITVEAWVYMESFTSSPCILSKGAGMPGTQYWMDVRDSGASFLHGGYAAGGGACYSTVSYAFETGKWYHLAWTYNKERMIGYIDGVEIGNAAKTCTFLSNEENVIIGGRGTTGQFFDGTIDEVRIYSRALSADEVRSHYLGGISMHKNSDATAKLVFHAGNAVLTTSVESLSGWHHVAGSWKSDEAKLYLDGVLKTSDITVKVGGNFGSDSYFGNDEKDGIQFDGKMDEVRVSETARTAPWIKASYHSGADTLCNIPTLVELSYFDAKAFDSYVLLEWETASELDNAGFHLWWSDTEGEEYTRLTDYLIPAEGGATWGACYSYEDYDVDFGQTYYYKLEDIHYDGASGFHGPVSVGDRSQRSNVGGQNTEDRDLEIEGLRDLGIERSEIGSQSLPAVSLAGSEIGSQTTEVGGQSLPAGRQAGLAGSETEDAGYPGQGSKTVAGETTGDVIYSSVDDDGVTTFTNRSATGDRRQISEVGGQNTEVRREEVEKIRRSEDEGHPGEMRSDKLNAKRCDSVNLTRQAVVNEFHPSMIVPTYGAGRAGKSEGVGNLQFTSPATFEWDSEGFERFRLEFSQAPDFETGVITLPLSDGDDRWITGNIYTPCENEWQEILRAGRTFYWRVYGENGSDSSTSGATGPINAR